MALSFRFAAVGLSMGLVACASAAPVQYTAIELSAYSNDFSYSQANALNDVGQAVGFSKATSADRAILWSSDQAGSQLNDLSNLPQLQSAQAFSINNFGQVVGSSRDGDRSRAFLWTPSTANGTSGTMIEILGLPGERNSGRAGGINSSGQVVGTSGASAYLWTPNSANATTGTSIDLGNLPGGFDASGALGVSDNGRVVGYSSTASGDHGFIWTPSSPNGDRATMKDLGTLTDAAGQSMAIAVNDALQVVGRSVNDAGQDRAVLWSAEKSGEFGITDLGTLPGGNGFSSALDINATGQVVGYSNSDDSDHAFLWTAADGMVDLNSLLDSDSAAKWTLRFASSINDHGEIAGWGTFDPDGPSGEIAPATRGFLLIANVPEPTGVIMAVLGIAAAQRRRRRS